MTSSERENSIAWFNREHEIQFELNQLKLKNKIKKLVEQGDTNIKIIEETKDGCLRGTMPLEYLRISKPGKRNLSKEQREAVAIRFHKKKSKSEE